MKTFEYILAEIEARMRKPGRFKELCSSVFQGVEGAELLAMLCTAEHPLDHTPGATDHQHGRREVIASLWRFGSGTNAIFTVTPDDPTIKQSPEAGNPGSDPE